MDTTRSATCDQCGESVRARFVVSLPSGNILTYCGHCTEKYRPGLSDVGAFIYQIGEP